MLAGTELRKQRRLSEVLTDSFNILFAHWRQLAIISVPVVIANIAFSLVILAITQDLPAAEEEWETDEVLDTLLIAAVTVLVAVPIFFVLQQLVTGGTVEYLDEADKGNILDSAEALDRAQSKLGALIGATLRAFAIGLLIVAAAAAISTPFFVVGGFAALIGVGVFLIGFGLAMNRFIRWIFLAQVIMIENKRGQEVLARSAELVRGRWWNTLGRLIVVGLVIGIPIGVLQQALIAAAPGIVGTILSSATGFISVPFGIIAVSLMFFDLRARKGEDVTGTPEEPPA